MRRIPTHLRLLKGNPSKRPIPAEPEPEVPENMPEAPPFLTGYARDEWWSTGPHLVRLRLLTAVDLTCFAAYCQSYAMWRTATETFAQMSERDATTHGLLVKRQDGNAARNPLVLIASNAAADMVRYAGEFGLTPVARSRIAAGVYAEPAGKFDGLLGG
jgi:P27 family predicted phage terminase small subunit